MNKKLIIIPIILVIAVGALFYFQNRQSVNNIQQEVTVDQKTSPESTVATTPKSVIKKLESASAFATRVLKYNQSSDFGKMYDLVCPADRAGATKIEYVKAMVGVWGNVRIVSFTVKDALEEPNGATVPFVMNTSDSQTQNDLFTLEKNGSEWCFRSSITGLVAQVKAYQNIKMVVNGFDKPYHPPYTTIEAGQEGIRVNVSITNSSNTKLVCYLGDGSIRNCKNWDFVLVDSNGTIYESVYLSGAEMPEFQIVPGGTVSGPVGFRIPAGSSGYKIIFRDLGTQVDIAEAPTGF
mgnify:FL=1